MDDNAIKQQVRQFYNQVGWQMVSEGMYQNAAYEDLRPVSHDYIRACHLRVGRFLKSAGKYLLDAGSGPIQYPEYLAYSQGYTYRVCADISIVALEEARKRIGNRGLYVVADVANLPFKPGAFEGVVSLHTLHHLPLQDHGQAYQELFRVLASGCSAVVVNGWSESPLMNRMGRLVRWMERRQAHKAASDQPTPASQPAQDTDSPHKPAGTFVHKFDAAWLRRELNGKMPFEIRVWRTVSVRFLRAMIQPELGGRFWLRLLYRLEELFPHFLGEKGQYPLVVIRKPE